MRCSIIVAVNDESVLRSCLLASPDLQEEVEIIIERGHKSASSAYNSGAAKAQNDLLIFVHQDVYLPPGWMKRVEDSLMRLNQEDPNWGVAGVWGAPKKGSCIGHMFWTGITEPRGGVFGGGLEVKTLDEVVLIFRKSSGLRFDPDLPGYHMYGTDICYQAAALGKKNYALSALCIHNTDSYVLFPWVFWRAYWHMRRKWRAQLPIPTSCVVITPWCWPALRAMAGRTRQMLMGRLKRIPRAADPAEVYRSLRLPNISS